MSAGQRSRDEWAAALKSSGVEQRRTAAEQLSQMGEEAAVAAIPLLDSCADEDHAVRELVVAALEEMGPPDVAELPALLKRAKSDNALTGYWSVTLIGRLGKEAATATDALASALTTAAPEVRQRAAWALGKIGASAANAIPALQETAEGSDERLARLSKQAIAAIRGSD